MIKNILEKDPGAASKKDEYGRHPLHIAVDSGASADVVKLLLGADKAIGNVPTEHLRWLPLHIVLYRGCHDTIENVVKELLDADERGLNIQARTAIGRLPLHIAIEKKVPTEVIKLLLPNETVYENIRLLLPNETVYEKFNGKLPIHIACWK
jgi:ankyrin repeat protein